MNKITIAIIGMLAIAIFLIGYFSYPKSEEIMIESEIKNIEQGSCSGGNYAVSCPEYAVFEYKENEYKVLLGYNQYAKSNCEDLLGSENCDIGSDTDNRPTKGDTIKVTGIYNQNNNTLTNITLTE